MKNLAVARRYAKALLLIAKDDGQAEVYKEELNNFSDLMKSEKELERAICNPVYDVAGRKKVLQAVVQRLEISKVMSSFLMFLFDKGRISFLDSINDFYKNLADGLKGIARASLVSATVLSEDAIGKIKSTLSKMTGKEIVLEVEQDPSLIGGVVTKIGDLVLDGSIKTQLLNMRESLKRGESV